MNDIPSTAMTILLDAARIPQRHFRRNVVVDNKDGDSPVTIADRDTEQFIRARLAEAFPDHAVTGEEFEAVDSASPYRWIIDPIDGTKSFVTGFPLFGMLLGLLRDDRPIFGAIHMPQLSETYFGADGRSTLNGTDTLKTRYTSTLSDARVYINEGEKIHADDPMVFASLCQLGSIRRLSYDCYPHALVAAGQIDICIDYDLKPYDFLPLVPIVEGAGGIITDWHGNALTLESGGRVISSANERLHQELVTTLAKVVTCHT